MSAQRLNLILLPCLLALALPGWAEDNPTNAKATQGRPLNLSLPRDVLQAPAPQPSDEKIEHNLRAPIPSPESNGQARPATLPYGAGYEYRHREMGGAGPGANAAGNAGTGRRGR